MRILKARWFRTTMLMVATTGGLLFLAIFFMGFGVSMVGGVDEWERLREEASVYLLIWRAVLYAAVIWVWIRFKKRVLEQDPDSAAPERMRRAEIATAICVVLFELSRAGIV